MKYKVLFEPDSRSGFTVTVPDLPGCVSQGETANEAMANIGEAIALYRDDGEQEGDPLTPTFSINAEYVRIIQSLVGEGWMAVGHRGGHMSLQKRDRSRVRKVTIPMQPGMKQITIDRILDHARA